MGINSAYKLADILDDEKWYHQKIQRLETGKTRLTDEDAHDIARRLRQAGYDIKSWQFFVDPAEVTITEDSREDALLRSFRELDDGAKRMYLHLLNSYAAGGPGKIPENGDKSAGGGESGKTTAGRDS